MKDKISGIELCDGCEYSNHKKWLAAKKDTCVGLDRLTFLERNGL